MLVIFHRFQVHCRSADQLTEGVMQEHRWLLHFHLQFYPMMKCFLAFLLTACCFGCSVPDSSHPTPPQATPAHYLQELRTDYHAQGPIFSKRLGCYVDLRLPDTTNRFFLFDLQHGTVLLEAPCLNGLTDENQQVRYSNRPNSNCSSRGLAYVSGHYRGNFGRAYRLCGLDSSNSNLLARHIVLHSWFGVPAVPGTTPLIQSQGCPTLNPRVLAQLATHLDGADGLVLVRFR